MRIRICGIYRIQSTIKPERIYIGSSVNIYDRKRIHYRELRQSIHASRKMQRHFNKYGESDLIFSIIEQFEFVSKEHLLMREQYYLDLYHPYFNTMPTAGSPLGMKLSLKTRRKISSTQKGRPSPKKGKPSGIIPWNKGRKNVYSEKTLTEMGKGRLGKKPWNKGRSGYLTEESRSKMRRVFTPEHIAKLRLAHAGVPLSDEHARNAAIGHMLVRIDNELADMLIELYERRSSVA